ncbi:MAG: hypothetical protein R2746_10410 [Acidimicrobiales bacterium]
MVLDDHAGDPVRRLEADEHLGLLVGRERGGPPGEREPVRWLPGPDPSDLVDGPVGVGLEQPLVHAGLDRQLPVGLAGRLEQAVRPPPLADLGGERLNTCWRRLDAQRDEHP